MAPFYAECRDHGADIGFMVQQEVGPTIDRYVRFLERGIGASLERELEYIRSILMIGRKSFYMLHRLHSFGVLHGDIHASNIAFADPNTD